MEHYTIILVLMGVMTLLSALAERWRVSSPIVLILAGMAMGFIPSMPPIALDPEVIFLLFLPPLLYDAAFKLRFEEFKKNLGTISSMAFGLVFLTTVGIAVIAHYAIPGMSWPLAFVLGAILSSTDAVAALSITKGLGLSPLTVTILEGESLLNDASALVAYRCAIAAMSGVAFIWWKAGLSFVVLIAGGYFAGWAVGKLLVSVLKLVRKNELAVLGFTLLAPFITYLVAEHFHCSGVIAVVVLGFNISRISAQHFPDKLKLQSTHIWELLVFMLNGLIFILIGLEFPQIIKMIPAGELWRDAGYAVLITIAALVIRTVRVLLKTAGLRLGYRHPKRQNGRHAITESMLLNLQDSLIISWSGMRGIISLAIAVGLPNTLSDGQPFPMRATIIYITTVVVLITIVGQGFLLPLLMKRSVQEEAEPIHTYHSKTL